MGLQWEADYQDPKHEVATPAEPLEHGNWCHIPTLCYWRYLTVQTLFFPLCSWHATISDGQCPTLRILLQFVSHGYFMDTCYLQTNMAFDEFPTKKKILNSVIIQNMRNLAPQEQQWLTVLRLQYCLQEETWYEWIPEMHPCLVAWSIIWHLLHHFPCSCNFSLLRCGSEAGRTTQAPLFQHFSVVCWVAFSWQQHLARGSVGLSVDVCWATVDSQLVLF